MLSSEAIIRQAEPRLKSYKISDSGGLYVSIQPGGFKLWRFKYCYEGIESTLSFGPHPGVSLIDAREKRRRARRLLAADQDPRVELSHEATRQTFEAATLLWHDNRKHTLDPAHAARLMARYYAAPQAEHQPDLSLRDGK